MSDPEIEDLVGDVSPSFEHVLSCVFGIRDHESRTYLTLLDHPGSTVAELAEALDRDRSNVNRSLSTLRDKGLVERRRRLLDSGGYVYQYTAVPVPEAKERLHEALDEWVEGVHAAIESFDPDGSS
ncbi:TrmB family transcriptional regulator [Halorubrum sp. Ib24]|uniref:helix-turn-helix domain-containing protein n=1 Tax=unclassified Halorubrum TaxID=2642239 RepID=UPI000B97E1EE|nr:MULTISPECIES: helix-turn-helix domain-containing protein [unclassified Halorubrum]OYR41170.1 TrmB family transcriptional regulator [Halorubrum sp. Hd13]OYR42993.1 TrmB family transcriptional regulator [Halorubrum sp. Ib24]OYR46941.1 TrmB family transcriptional regulator [Halorubrum sp. Eb13]OYR47164.1 TrmB family transcriptional regulator [Halorubrum sp. Ea8]OYR54336.1 TrmB family transcriptional regulator [Halorubrum sp. Ea1]